MVTINNAPVRHRSSRPSPSRSCSAETHLISQQVSWNSGWATRVRRRRELWYRENCGKVEQLHTRTADPLLVPARRALSQMRMTLRSHGHVHPCRSISVHKGLPRPTTLTQNNKHASSKPKTYGNSPPFRTHFSATCPVVSSRTVLELQCQCRPKSLPVLSCSLQHFTRLSHNRTQTRHLHGERDSALRWLEGLSIRQCLTILHLTSIDNLCSSSM